MTAPLVNLIPSHAGTRRQSLSCRGMKMPVAAILLQASATLACAHDVRHSDGRELPHDHAVGLEQFGGMRNVSALVAAPTSCEAATWPDIPAGCLERAPAITAPSYEQPRRTHPVAPAPQPSQSRVRMTLSPSIVLLGWNE